jgi:hypothetical protein
MSSAVVSSTVAWPPLRASRELFPEMRRLRELPRGVVPGSQLEARPAPATVSSGIAEVDALTGGLPRGALSEIFGVASCGRTSLALAALAAATRRQEVCALVDAGDSLHPRSAAAAGVDLQRLLWIRCGAFSPQRHGGTEEFDAAIVNLQLSPNTKLETRSCADTTRNCARNRQSPIANRQSSLWDHRLTQVLKATDLLLQSGGFGMVVVDLADVPPRWARRIPLASWFRFRRAVENTPTVLLVMEQEPYAKTCASLALKMQPSALSSQHSASEGSWQKHPLEKGNRTAPPLIASRDVPAHAHILRAVPVRAEVVHDRLQRKPAGSVSAQFQTHASWASPLAG